jgi:hypothetical protein
VSQITVEAVGPRQYKVGNWWVDLNAWDCDCPHKTLKLKHDETCKHMAAALKHEGEHGR